MRVVSLNCAGGLLEAAREVAAYRPDVVLLQESPGAKEVRTLARELFGEAASALPGVDASIIVNGQLEPRMLPRKEAMSFVQARARLTNGLEAEVVSLRLLPACIRVDLWSPTCWREHSANRRDRREMMAAIANRLHALPHEVPVVVGGDFNAPPGDAVFRLLGTRLRDAYHEAGVGLGNTIENSTPLIRIDQVWVSEQLVADAVVARKTTHSDHRLVVCDLRLR